MAGTRYYLQAIVLLQVIVLVAVSYFYGFCIRTNYDDDLCLLLLRHRGGGSGSDSDTTTSSTGTLELLLPPPTSSLLLSSADNNNNNNDEDNDSDYESTTTCTSTTATISNQKITIPVSTIEEVEIWSKAAEDAAAESGEEACPSSLSSSSSAGRLTFDFVLAESDDDSTNNNKLTKVCQYHDPTRTNTDRPQPQDQDEKDEATLMTKERSLWFCPPMTDSDISSYSEEEEEATTPGTEVVVDAAEVARVVIYQQSMIIYPTTSTTSSNEGYQSILSNLLKIPPQAITSLSQTLFHLQLVIEVDIEGKSSKSKKSPPPPATRYWTHAISTWKRKYYDEYFLQKLQWPILTSSNSITFNHRIKFVPATTSTKKLVQQNIELAKEERKIAAEKEEEKQRLSGNVNQDENDDNTVEKEVESPVVDEVADVDQAVEESVKPKPFTTEQIQQILLQATSADGGSWSSDDDEEAKPTIDITIYVPYEVPLPLEDAAIATSWMINPRHVATLVTGKDYSSSSSDNDGSLKDDSYYYRAIETAMNNVGLEELLLHDIMHFDWLVLSKESKSLQNTPLSSSPWFLVDSWDGSFPKWYSQRVYREKIVSLLHLTSTELQQSYNLINRHNGIKVESNDTVNMTVKAETDEGKDGDFLSSIMNLFSSSEDTASPPSVRPMDAATRKTVFQLYNDARELYEVAVTAAGTVTTSVHLSENINDDSLTDVDAIVIRLEESLRKAKSIPMFIPLKKHFPWEHYMAMFAPLLFPLFLPFVISLIRERKRYKTKIKEKKEKEASQ